MAKRGGAAGKSGWKVSGEWLILGVLLLGLTGCLVRRRERLPAVPLAQNLQKATLEELLQKIEGPQKAIETLSATVEIQPSVSSPRRGEVVHYRDVRAFILIRRPALLRMIGLYPVVRNTAFDLASDGENFGLYIPSKNRFIMGKSRGESHSESALENLRPQHILDALLWKGPEARREQAVLEAASEGEKAYYVVSILASKANNGLLLARKFWFERQGLSLERLQVFDEMGEQVTDVRYSDYGEFSGIPYAQKISVDRPKDQYGLSLSVSKLEFNQRLEDEKFHLEQPSGAEVINLEKQSQEKAAGVG